MVNVNMFNLWGDENEYFDENNRFGCVGFAFERVLEYEQQHGGAGKIQRFAF